MIKNQQTKPVYDNPLRRDAYLRSRDTVLSYYDSKDFIQHTLCHYLQTHANQSNPTEYVDSNTMFALTEFYGFHIFLKGNQYGNYVSSGNNDPEFEVSIEVDMEEILEELEEEAEEEFTRDVVECFLMTAKAIFVLASESAMASVSGN